MITKARVQCVRVSKWLKYSIFFLTVFKNLGRYRVVERRSVSRVGNYKFCTYALFSSGTPTASTEKVDRKKVKDAS